MTKLKNVGLWMWRMRQELIGLPVAVAIFLVSPMLLYAVDRTAGVWDVGTLQGLSVASVQLIVANTVARVGAAVNFRFVFGCDHKQDTTCRRWYAALFAFYFLAYLVLVVAL